MNDLSPDNCRRLAQICADKGLLNALINPGLRGLAPLDQLSFDEKLAELRTLGLLDEDRSLTRLGKRVDFYAEEIR